MRFLRRASSFLNSLRSSDSDGKNLISTVGGLLSKIGLVKILLFAFPIVIIFIVFLTFVSMFTYNLNLLQMVDHSGGKNRSDDVESASACANKNGITRILFLGNSRTYVHDIPGKVKGFAESDGYRVEITAPDSATDGGMLLEELYLSKSDQLEKSYDCVVLQEQSDTYMRDYDTFLSGATKIVDKVKSVNSSVKTYIRQTWTTSQYINLDSAYENAEAVAKATDSYLILDGKAFEKSRDDYPSVTIFGDGIHQNANGAYLSAAVIYETLFGKDVKNSGYNDGVGADVAEQLKTVASAFAVNMSAERQKIIEAAKSQLGIPYTGEGSAAYPGVAFNCSGLTWWSYEQAGLSIPHSQGYNSECCGFNGEDSQSYWVHSKSGHYKTDISECQPADLVFFSSSGRWDYTYHVGLYLGNNEMIHANGSEVAIGNYNSSGDFVGCGWPLD